jgi:hypothetical protein
MNSAALTALTRVLKEQFGFITDADFDALMQEPTLHRARIVVRRHTGRDTAYLKDIPGITKLYGDADIRDIAFASAQHRSLERLLDNQPESFPEYDPYIRKESK